jgi:succinate dehydrogenase / fumarate reductase flavoprotein subunit
VLIDGKARGVVTRSLVDGRIESHVADAVILCTGGYSNVFYLSTNAMACNTTAIWRAHRRGAGLANPCFTQIHPTCIPASGPWQSKLTLMSESLRNDGRIWVPKAAGDKRAPGDIPEDERDYYLERFYPSFGNLSPRDISSRRAKEMVDTGHGVGPQANGVYLDFADAIDRLGAEVVKDRYGNLFDMYKQITGESPYETPMRIYPAAHFTMGGLWVDYHLQSNIPGLFVAGEANFSDHGANRLGASALMQGLADGYFVLPYTLGNYLAQSPHGKADGGHPACAAAEAEVRERIGRLMGSKGKHSAEYYHRELGKIIWDHCGMARSESGLRQAIGMVAELREKFWDDVLVPGAGEDCNVALESAGRVADFFELAELMCHDALDRAESCGAHFREEFQTEEGEAKRNDDGYSYVSVWEFTGVGNRPKLHKESLTFEYVKPSTRSYK